DSFISTEDYAKWFSGIWTDVKGQRRTDHPAPYPVEIPRRLIRMFSFTGDTVLDPFGGTGTTAVAAIEMGRHSISVDVEPRYIDIMESRLSDAVGFRGQLEVKRKATSKRSAKSAVSAS